MGRYQRMGQLVEVRQAGESRRSRAFAMFEQGMTPSMVSKRMGLSRTAMIRLREEWVMETAPAADDFDPSLAIGVYDYERPMPVHCRMRHKRTKPEDKAPAPYKERFPSKEAADESWSVESPLLTATDRALKLRTAEAYAACLALMGKGRG